MSCTPHPDIWHKDKRTPHTLQQHSPAQYQTTNQLNHIISTGLYAAKGSCLLKDHAHKDGHLKFRIYSFFDKREITEHRTTHVFIQLQTQTDHLNLIICSLITVTVRPATIAASCTQQSAAKAAEYCWFISVAAAGLLLPLIPS